MSTSEELDSMFASVPEQLPVGARPPSKLNYSHAGMIDLILACPGITQNEIAAKLGYSASWVSIVQSTDVFKAELEKRRKEVIDPTLLASIQERFEGLARRSLAVLEEKLSAPAAMVSDNLALRSFEVTSRAAGYGARDLTPPTPPAEIHVHLESMAENLKGLLRRSRASIEHEPALPPPGDS